MPLADFVGLAYQKKPEQVNFELAMQVLKEATKRFSAEFGIRYLINAEPEKSMIILNQWATDENYHVRRLASEGSRPRLPWGMQLSSFIDDPKPLFTLLEQLKDDNEEYVRRSVANSLNDIAKDHPKLIEDLAERWVKNADKNRIKLIKHACRTLIKKGNKRILAALGFSRVALKNSKLTLNTNTLMFGNSLMLTLKLNSNSHQEQLINIDYIVHHQKANGSTSPKVFKWQSRTLKANEALLLTKKHTIKPITTRVYYPGVHKIEVLINGDVVCHNQFDLII
jgi:3-methyladenine DNA glycosylase AlkC